MRKPRHLKSQKKGTWTALRAEIDHLCKELSISKADFSEVGIHEWRDIQSKVWSAFSNPSDWFWGKMPFPHASVVVDYQVLYFANYIDPEEFVWFIVDESANMETKFWFYQGKAGAIDSILDESCLIKEIMVVSKKLDWILTYDHHWVLSGSGPMKAKIEALKKRIPTDDL